MTASHLCPLASTWLQPAGQRSQLLSACPQGVGPSEGRDGGGEDNPEASFVHQSRVMALGKPLGHSRP